jgi:allantoinase
MTLPDLVIRGKRIVLPDGPAARRSSSRIASGSIHIGDGRITSVGSYDDVPPGCELVEANDESLVMPGLVDTHVHINEPGRTEWEGFQTATRAAAAGGVTTLVDMPLNSIPPTTTLSGLNAKLDAARPQCHVDVAFWGGVIPGNTSELANLRTAGVVGFKCFLIHSGVDEFPNVTEEDLRQAMPELTRLGSLLIVHAELPGPIASAAFSGHRNVENSASLEKMDKEIRPAKYRTFLESRPRAAENEAVQLMIRLSREFGTRVHVVHHSSADALPLLAEARQAGVKITAETCPHYLTFAAEDVADGATEFKCCPPIRERENREQLWRALGDGTIDMIVSDHSPCLPELKLKESGDFLEAWGGISSLQFRLPVIWTEARKRGFGIEDLAEWLCTAPAKLVRLEKRKGLLAVGCDADVVIWNPEKNFRIEPESIQHRHKLTPYAGKEFMGEVQTTFLRGRKVYDAGDLIGEPQGRMLLG